MNIAKVKYLKDYVLEATFDNGEVRIANFCYFLNKAKNPMTTQFRDKDRFKNVKIDHGDLTWEDGEMDFSAEDIYTGEFLQMEITDLEELKHEKEILIYALTRADKTEAERSPVEDKLRMVTGYIEILQSYLTDPARADLQLRIAEIPNVGVFIVVFGNQIEMDAKLAVVKVIDQPVLGFKTEMLLGANGHTYLKIADHHTPEYGRFYRVIEELGKSPE